MTTRDEDFRDFFVGESENLQRFATLLTGDPHQAADLAQEAMVRTYKHWRRIQNDRPGPYARRIVINLVRSAHRHKKLRELKPVGHQRDRVESEGGRVDEWLRVSAALEQLSPIRRATLVLRFYEDMSEHEIATVLDRPLGTVKSDIHRALNQLRPLLDDTAREQT
jgi:RNA polymerase sigma-70 factor (sigma-E family)